MSNISIPAIPSDWIAHSGVLPAGNGYRTWVEKVLHRASEGSYHPFVIHRAYEHNGKWAYESGHYFMTEAEALVAFNK